MAKVKASKKVPQAAQKIGMLLKSLKVVGTVTYVEKTISIDIPYCDEMHARSVRSVAQEQASKYNLAMESQTTRNGLLVSLAA